MNSNSKGYSAKSADGFSRLFSDTAMAFEREASRLRRSGKRKLFFVGASLLAMDVNGNASLPNVRGALESIASEFAPAHSKGK